MASATDDAGPPRNMLGDVPYDAELVALGIGEDDELILWVFADPSAGRSERLDLARRHILVLRDEVDVHTVLHDLALRYLLEPDPHAVIGSPDREPIVTDVTRLEARDPIQNSANRRGSAQSMTT